MSIRYDTTHSSSPADCPPLTGHYLPLTSDLSCLNYTLLESAAVDPSLTSFHLHDNNNNNSSSCSNNVGGFYVDRYSYVQSPQKPRHVQQVVYFITGSIARSANLPVFSLLRGRFWDFSPRRGDTLHRWGWNLAWRRGPKVPSSTPNSTPNRCNDKGVGPKKLKFLLRFDRNLEYKRPAGAYPLREFHKICRVCTTFESAFQTYNFTWICAE